MKWQVQVLLLGEQPEGQGWEPVSSSSVFQQGFGVAHYVMWRRAQEW
jgi:hypothetical protein